MGELKYSAFLRVPRDDWFNLVETLDDWIVGDPIGEGESCAIQVTNVTDGMMAVAKPGEKKGADEICRAAHEKVAFDLAHVLGLPVSPVVLWNAEMPGKYKRGRAISCWAFPQAMKWNEADGKNLINEKARASAAPLVAMFRVFHTWIGDGDRKPDHLIVDLESPESELRFAAIDHGFSMSKDWRGPEAPIRACGAYLQNVSEDPEGIAEAIEAIERLDSATVKGLVDRIPEPYLPAPQRGYILSNLTSRQGKLRGAFGV